MYSQLNILKGIHPGIFLKRELQKHGLSSGKFAASIQEHPQTLSTIMQGKRSMNTKLAMRIEQELALEEGLLMTLQIHHDIKQEKIRQSAALKPNLSLIRPILFWDTKMDHIDWQHHKNAVIRRVFQKGNLTERKEIARFYDSQTIRHALAKA